MSANQGGAAVWRCGGREFAPSVRPLVMGILNVTPDSFSDGGRFYETERAVARGLEMLAEGADIVDVGGESSRPGAAPVAEADELARVIPVIKALSRAPGALISVDTRKSAVAERALVAGAAVVNDISAATADARMPEVIRRFRAGAILMHMRGEPGTMQDDPRYGDVVREVREYLERRVGELTDFGIEPEALAVDPGFGFGKTVEHNVCLLAGLEALAACGRPVAVGMSRKSFVGHLTGRAPDERLAGSLAALACAVARGAGIARVHDVRAARDVIAVTLAAMRGKKTPCCNG